MADRALTGNATKLKDIKFAERIEREREERYQHALREMLRTPAGRIVFAQIIRASGVFRSIWSPNVEIHFNAGRQSIGLELRHALQSVDVDLFDQMDADERAWLREQRTLTAGQQTKSVGRATTQDDVDNDDEGDE